MKGWLSLIFVLLAGGTAGGQDIAVGAGFGVSTTRMDDMKFLQEHILSTYPLEGKVIASFPPYTMGSINFMKQLYPTIRLGAGYAFAVTGGRSNYSDYSGSINTDMQANSYRFGGWVSYAFLSGERYDLSLYGRADINYSRIDISSTVYALGLSDGVINGYKAFSPAGSAGLEFYFHFNNFSIGMDAGYLVEKPGKLSNTSSGSELTDPRDWTNVLTTDWTGWRAQLKLFVWLGD
jgi:hypothetical protein